MLRHEDSVRAESDREGRGIRQLITLLALAFVVTLGVVVGTRMSSDAIAVLVGVIAGVAASIPCALLLMAVTRQRETHEDAAYDGGSYRDAQYDNPRYRQAPPVIVVTGGAVPSQQLPYGVAPYGAPYGYGAQHTGQQRRQFRVMGYDQEDDASVTVEGEVEGLSRYQ